MKHIRISDVTMCQQTEQIALSFKEKIELAKLLDRLGVDVICLEGLTGSRVDALRIKSIAAAVRDSVLAVPVALEGDNTQQVWAALSQASHPRLQVRGAVSSVQMEYIHHKKPEAMAAAIENAVAGCKALCRDVEFVAEDATRSDPAFLRQAVTAALRAGATTVTLCDTAGILLPEELTAFIQALRQDIPALEEAVLGIDCANTLSMADACAIAALTQGAGEVKAAAYPVNAASLAHISRIIAARGDSFQALCGVHVTQLSRVMEQVRRLCQSGAGRSPYAGGSAEEAGPGLSSHDDISAVLAAVARLGYELGEEDGLKVFDAFQAIAAKKEQVSVKELDAIVASAAMQVPPTYQLDTYVITTGNTISSTAHLRLKKAGAVLEGVCIGDGPIDAAFLAIESVTGQHYELDDFQIQAVTEGREAMGQTVVKLRDRGRLYSGIGLSTDIVGASIQAYLSALNKIVYEEDDV